MKRKLVGVLLAATMSLSLLAGCGGGSSTAGDASSSRGTSDAGASEEASSSESAAGAGASGEVDPSKEVELVMYVISDRPAGQDVVDENLNALLKEKLNCTLKINWIGWAEYAQKYPLLISSGEEFDLAYSATWLGFTSLAQRGAFMALDEMLPAYAPDNYAMQSESALQQATVNGKLYAVPTLLPTYTAYGSIYRGDLAAEAGITDSIDTFEEVAEFADYIVANHPEMEAIDMYSAGPELSLTWFKMNGILEVDSNMRYVFYDPSEEHPTVKAIMILTERQNFIRCVKNGVIKDIGPSQLWRIRILRRLRTGKQQ